jgi:hypothetical protein
MVIDLSEMAILTALDRQTQFAFHREAKEETVGKGSTSIQHTDSEGLGDLLVLSGLWARLVAEFAEVDAVEFAVVGVEEVEDGDTIDCGVFAQLPTCGGGAGVGGFAGLDFD